MTTHNGTKGPVNEVLPPPIKSVKFLKNLRRGYNKDTYTDEQLELLKDELKFFTLRRQLAVVFSILLLLLA